MKLFFRGTATIFLCLILSLCMVVAGCAGGPELASFCVAAEADVQTQEATEKAGVLDGENLATSSDEDEDEDEGKDDEEILGGVILYAGEDLEEMTDWEAEPEGDYGSDEIDAQEKDDDDDEVKRSKLKVKAKLSYSKKVSYESFYTRNYTVKVDGEKQIAYCVQPKNYPPSKGSHNAYSCTRELLNKALYYSYGYPGYEKETKAYLAGVDLKKCYTKSTGAYAFCHITLSYIYDGCSSKSDAFMGVSVGTKKKVKAFVAKIKTWDDPPSASLSLSRTSLEADWNSEKNVQITGATTLNGTSGNEIHVEIPEGVTMVRKSGDEVRAFAAPDDAEAGVQSVDEDDTVTVSSGDSFYFRAPYDVRGEYESPVMAGSVQDFQGFLIKVSGKQNQVFGMTTNGDAVQFSVQWAEVGSLKFRKAAETGDTDVDGLGGVSFDLIPESGETMSLKTNDSGYVSIIGLAYGKYTLREKRTAANKGYSLIDDVSITIGAASPDIDLGTIIDENLLIHTTATNAADGRNSVTADGTVTINDAVYYSGLKPGKQYEIRGVLMNRATGAELLVNGDTVESSVTFTADSSEGMANVQFSFNGGAAGPGNTVVYESLYEEGVLAAEHKDINDTGQTVELTAKPGDNRVVKTGDDTDLLALALAMLISAVCGGFCLMRRDSR